MLIHWTMPKSPGVVRIAALGDIHLGRAAYGPPMQTIFADVAERWLAGRLTDAAAVSEMAGRFLSLVDAWGSVRAEPSA